MHIFMYVYVYIHIFTSLSLIYYAILKLDMALCTLVYCHIAFILPLVILGWTHHIPSSDTVPWDLCQGTISQDMIRCPFNP